MAQANKRDIPAPVKMAQEALAILRAEDTVKAESVAKTLPAFALALTKQGIEVTVDLLLGHARTGSLDLKTVPEQKKLTYTDIVARLNASEEDEPDDERYEHMDSGELHGYFTRAAERGDIKKVKELLELGHGTYRESVVGMAQTLRAGQTDIVRLLIEHERKLKSKKLKGDWLTTIKDMFLELVPKEKRAWEEEFYLYQDMAAEKGRTDVVRLLLDEYGADINDAGGQALRSAVCAGHTDTARLLLDRGADIRAVPSSDLGAIRSVEIMHLLIERGACADNTFHSLLPDEYHAYCKAFENWKKVAHCPPPDGLWQHNPQGFKIKDFEAVKKNFSAENYQDRIANQMALTTITFFGTEARVLQYLEKWGEAGKQPLHDLIQHIKLPEEKISDQSLKNWSDAVLKCGPSMAALVAFADKLPSPEKSSDGKTWSMVKTREKVAQFAYPRAKESPALAVLCMEYAVDEQSFNIALDLSKKTPLIKNIPEITIDGTKFDMDGAKFYRLPANDIRGLFLGKITDCCQSIGNAGGDCAKHGFTSEDGGFYVVESAKGSIIAQTWAWRGEQGEMTFDTLETLGKNVTKRQWKKILKECAAELTQKPGDITALTVGMGGDTPNSLARTFNTASPPAKPRNYTGYTEARKQIVIWSKQR